MRWMLGRDSEGFWRNLKILKILNNVQLSSMQPASELPQSVQHDDEASAPVCKYEVLMESATGPTLSHATVGDQVYHK